MGVSDGQPVDAATTNPAFLDANANDTALGIISLGNVNPLSGAFIGNIQGLANHLRVTTGATETTDGTTYSSQQRITNGQNHQVALGGIDSAFHGTTGHKHTGAVGDAPPVASSGISGVPLHGYLKQAPDVVGASGTSSIVTPLMGGETNSTGPTVEGVVVTPPDNLILIRLGGSLGEVGRLILDPSNNVVYGRLTFLAGVWTLSYYVMIGNVETAYNFAVPTDLRWFYQKLYNPVTNAQVYSEIPTTWPDNIEVPGSSPPQSGGSFVWQALSGTPPASATEFNQLVYKFVFAATETLNAVVRVPSGYVAGTQIRLYIPAYSPSIVNAFLLTTTTSLIRTGVDAAGSITNQHISTNIAQMNAAPANLEWVIECDLTDAGGMINGVAVAAGDVLEIELTRGADSDTADVRVRPDATSPRWA